ncbi:N-acetylglucosamine kinase [Curtobacterium sp. RRHDQ10]|uniref:N-acetylglucosamine kinase n=1 Tax=Curtobacterium phyllosphaerae TaxID=3413379 RepID=UPI003BF03D1B
MDSLTPVVIAVDGGGSKTDVVAVDLDGRVVGHARGPGTNPQTQGWGVSGRILDDLRGRVLAALDGRAILTTHVYLAGMDFEEEIVEARAALAHWDADGGVPAVLDNDLFALLRAGTLAPDAVAVVCGTGINAIGVRADGATARFPAIGDLSGDWGGGAFLGNRALWHAARAEDGRGPATALQLAVPAAFDLPDVQSVTQGFHFGRIPGSAINRLSPVLFEVADGGDEVARAVIDRQAEEIVLLVVAAMRRLGLERTTSERSVTVVLGGGVLAARHPLLSDAVTARLAAAAPNAVPAWVTAPPILGAGLAALEAVGARPDALERYRSEIPQLTRGTATVPR